MRLGPRLVVIRAVCVTWKAARQRRRSLERELAGYSTPSQRRDLEATLDRYPDGVTQELRDILARHPVPDKAAVWPAGRSADRL